jgi:transmembrane sensor
MADDAPPDRNQQLAKRLGQLRAENASLEALADGDDELMEVLLAYRRKQASERPDPAPEVTERLWAGIESEMETAPPRRADRSSRRRREPVRRDRTRRLDWRLAGALAAVLVVGVVAWLLVPAQGPRLVAEAGPERVTHRTDAGDVIRLRPHTTLYRVRPDAPRYRVEGEAVFEVAPRDGSPFELTADGIRVRVLGTRFAVQTWTRRPTVFLEEGRLAVQNVGTGQGATLRPGESGTLTDDGGISVQTAAADPYVDWLNGRITFDSEPAGTVAAELAQHYGLRVHLPDSLAAQSVTGRLLLEERDQALEDFGRVLGGRFVPTDGGVRFHPDE